MLKKSFLYLTLFFSGNMINSSTGNVYSDVDIQLNIIRCFVDTAPEFPTYKLLSILTNKEEIDYAYEQCKYIKNDILMSVQKYENDKANRRNDIIINRCDFIPIIDIHNHIRIIDNNIRIERSDNDIKDTWDYALKCIQNHINIEEAKNGDDGIAFNYYTLNFLMKFYKNMTNFPYLKNI
jgi:hypothetical protein